jgi:hypothetical protein
MPTWRATRSSITSWNDQDRCALPCLLNVVLYSWPSARRSPYSTKAHPCRTIPTDRTEQLPQVRAPQSYPPECEDGVYFSPQTLSQDDRMAVT